MTGTLAAIVPDWPAPPTVRAFATARTGGVSVGRYASLNLGSHVGDVPAAVAANRALLRARLDLPAEPAWLEQVHGVGVATPAELAAAVAPVRADAAYAGPGGPVCAILTADCLPVLLCDRRGRWVAAAHAGWRGLAAGVIEATVAALRAAGVAPHELLAWLGPGIRAPAYEVGDEVRSAFLAADPAAASGFAANARGRWQLDLPALARQRLAAAGVGQVHGGTRCTHAEPARFFSHRRDGQTGRQATLIWLERG